VRFDTAYDQDTFKLELDRGRKKLKLDPADRRLGIEPTSSAKEHDSASGRDWISSAKAATVQCRVGGTL